MPSTDGSTTYKYSVLNYAPTAISESIAPCLVLAEAHSIENAAMRVFASRQCQKDLPEADREYIAAFIEHAISLSGKEVEQLLEKIQGISVGPLRPGAFGVCDEMEFPHILKKVFGQVGYDVLEGAK